MKKHLLAAAVAVTIAFIALPRASAQTAAFSFNDGNGTPNAGSYSIGSSFTLQIMLSFTPGGSVSNLEGLSYWFQQLSPGSPFHLSITNRDLTGSLFSDAQTPGIMYPQSLAPRNLNDLGAILPGVPGLGAGNYFIANLTIAIDAAVSSGTYVIGNTTSGGTTSVVTDDQGHTFAILGSIYTITVVPDSGSSAVLLGLAVLGLAGLHRQLRARAV